jgi:galactosylceramidase
LLANYPAAQRASVLDMLFTPQLGAALGILKVEIGADGLAANAGGEPAVRHTPDGPPCYNGTNFFLMREAARRNPRIVLVGLSWSLPGWFEGRSAFTTAQAEYTASWCDGVQAFHTGDLYVGIRNEFPPTDVSAGYAKLLRRVLNRRGHGSVRIVWPDSNGGAKHANHSYGAGWDVAAAMVEADAELRAAVHTLSAHYPQGSRTCAAPAAADYRSTCAGGAAARTSKPLWDSEAWGDGATGDLVGGATLARLLNWEPIVGKFSATIVWQILWANYDGLGWTSPSGSCVLTGFLPVVWIAIVPMGCPYENPPPTKSQGWVRDARWADNALVRAAEPWSGAFEVLPPAHAAAHTSHFVRHGWRYTAPAGGFLPRGGTYVTRVSPDGADFSVVIEALQMQHSDPYGKRKVQGNWSVSPTQQVELRIVGGAKACEGWPPLMRVESTPFAGGTGRGWFVPQAAVALQYNRSSGECHRRWSHLCKQFMMNSMGKSPRNDSLCKVTHDSTAHG